MLRRTRPDPPTMGTPTMGTMGIPCCVGLGRLGIIHLRRAQGARVNCHNNRHCFARATCKLLLWWCDVAQGTRGEHNSKQ